MKIKIKQDASGCADAVYEVTARGCVTAALFWGDANGAFDNWSALGYIPLDEFSGGSLRLFGGRGIPPEATHVWAKAVGSDFETVDTISAEVENTAVGSFDLKICAVSDIHVTRKTWALEKAIRLSEGADALLIVGDTTNDGTAEQFALIKSCIEKNAGGVPIFAVDGNHDIPTKPRPYAGGEVFDYYSMQDWLLERSGADREIFRDGTYIARVGKTDIVGLNCVTHWRKFRFADRGLPERLDKYLSDTPERRHIIMCHAPLFAHSHQNSGKNKVPYISRDAAIQRILDKYGDILFLSGHIHMSPNSSVGSLEASGGNIYYNCGTLCPSKLEAPNEQTSSDWIDGVFTEIYMGDRAIEVRARSIKTGKYFARGYYRNSELFDAARRASV